MTKVTRIAFYGASVTQQSIDRHGNKTGYVNHVIDLLKSKYSHIAFDFIQTGYGSSHFDDAGYIYFHELLETTPDIVVMDWHSTGLDSFDPVRYAYVMDTLFSLRIKVLNCVFPRKRYLGKQERQNVMQTRWYEENRGFPLLNLYENIGTEIDIDRCLRDDVHTNEYGAEVYAKIIFESLKAFLDMKPHRPSVGSTIPPPADYAQPLVSRFPIVAEIRRNQVVEVIFDKTKFSPICLFGKMNIGPFSPVIEVKSHLFSERLNIWDQWCHYSRQTLKRLTSDILSNFQGRASIELRISNDLPDYKSAMNSSVNFEGIERYLSICGFLYLVGAKIVDVKIYTE